ncbi:MAG: type III-A CRISPR-associated protein Cas10/Csm1, partial [Planctomycetota bacterium]
SCASAFDALQQSVRHAAEDGPESPAPSDEALARAISDVAVHAAGIRPAMSVCRLDRSSIAALFGRTSNSAGDLQQEAIQPGSEETPETALNVAQRIDEALRIQRSAFDQALGRETAHQIAWRLEQAVATIRPLSEVGLISQDEPAATPVNLHDTARIAAAFAGALARQHQASPFGNAEDAENVRVAGRFRLVQLSLGGIQRFIFRTQPRADQKDTTERGRAKSLRARSFYISLVSHAAAREVLRAAGLPPTNILIEAGGRVILLLPAIPDADAHLREALKRIRAWFIQELGGMIRFDVGVSDPLSVSDLADSTFAQVLRDLDARVTRERLRFIAAEFARSTPRSTTAATADDVGSPSIHWQDPDRWILPTKGLPTDDDPFTTRMRKLGEKLPKAVAVRICNNGDDGNGSDHRGSSGADTRGRDHVDAVPLPVSQHAVIVQDNRVIEGATPEPGVYRVRSAGHTAPAIDAGRWIPIADEDDVRAAAAYEQARQKRAAISIGDRADDDPDQRSPTDSDLDLQVGHPIPFDLIAQRASDEHGNPIGHAMLGVLKADVDRLGRTMAYGLSSGLQTTAGANVCRAASPTRFATVSREMNRFFQVDLDALIQKQFPNTYTVYAGGDDLFLIGPWLDIVHLTAAMRRRFTEFTSDHPEVTISAGLAFVRPGVPVRTMADAAESALEDSKSGGRNRVTIWGSTVDWSTLHDGLEMCSLLREALGLGVNGSRPTDDDSAAPAGAAVATPTATDAATATDTATDTTTASTAVADIERDLQSSAPREARRTHGRDAESRSFVYRLLTYTTMAGRMRDALRKGRPFQLADAKWRSQLNYDLRRTLVVDREKDEDEGQQEAVTSDSAPQRSLQDATDPRLQLREQLLKLNHDNIEVLRIAAMITLYTLRKETTT